MKCEEMANIVFSYLHNFSRIEQLDLLEEELIGLIQHFEESDICRFESDIIELFENIRSEATYERSEQVWGSIERKIKTNLSTEQLKEKLGEKEK